MLIVETKNILVQYVVFTVDLVEEAMVTISEGVAEATLEVKVAMLMVEEEGHLLRILKEKYWWVIQTMENVQFNFYHQHLFLQIQLFKQNSQSSIHHICIYLSL